MGPNFRSCKQVPIPKTLLCPSQHPGLSIPTPWPLDRKTLASDSQNRGLLQPKTLPSQSQKPPSLIPGPCFGALGAFMPIPCPICPCPNLGPHPTVGALQRPNRCPIDMTILFNCRTGGGGADLGVSAGAWACPGASSGDSAGGKEARQSGATRPVAPVFVKAAGSASVKHKIDGVQFLQQLGYPLYGVPLASCGFSSMREMA